ncbi:MAG: SPASM domain-containing protein [Candidatus Abyssubacteria bacterium]|nr:SPASM domain-containing protein [Candidatus Abyssubacteria bacterium]
MYLHQFMAATCEDVHALSPQEMADPQMSGYLDSSDARPFCLAPFRTIYIKSDGAVKPCCFHEDDHFLGNANEASLLEIWNGEKFVKFREKMINGQVPKACFHCVENCLRPMQDDSELIYSLIANKVSIAVISLNNAGEIQNTIDSLRAQQHNKEIVDFIAVDIGSADRTVEILEENEVKTFRFDPDNDIDLLRFVLEKTTGFTISLVHGDAMPIYGQWLDSIPFASWRSSSAALLISDRRQGSSGTGALGEKGPRNFPTTRSSGKMSRRGWTIRKRFRTVISNAFRSSERPSKNCLKWTLNSTRPMTYCSISIDRDSKLYYLPVRW